MSQAWNIARGFKTNGNIIIDPTINKSTKFPLSGDPVSESGWIYTQGTGGGAGFNLFTGPFNLAPNDPQWLMMTLIPGRGKDQNESISMMREKAKILRSLPYDTLAFGAEIKKKKVEKTTPSDFELFQNYPNPFNLSTVIKYSIPRLSRTNSAATTNVELKIYDILGREVKTLVNRAQASGNYRIDFNAGNLVSGIYIYTFKVGDFYKSKKFILLK